MNRFEKIKYLRELEIKKDKLEKQLESINNNIEEEKDLCSHISVDLGYYGLYPKTGDKYRCLICGKGKGDEYFYEPNYVVHAENYLPQYDIKDEIQSDTKFNHIQTIFIGLLKEDPTISREELVDKMNNLIQQSILFRESENEHKLMKTKNLKR